MKAKTRNVTVESMWKVITQQADKSRVRKAKQDARAGLVSRVQKQPGGLVATVRASGPERGTFQVFLPLLADYTSGEDMVSSWLARRPDWLAAHFAGEWERSFFEFIKENGLRVFPDHHTWGLLQSETRCTCSDGQPLCAHTLAFLFDLIWQAEERPLTVFQFVGLNEDELLNRAHVLSSKWTAQHEATASGRNPGINENRYSDRNMSAVAQLLTDIEVVEPSGRLIPRFRG